MWTRITPNMDTFYAVNNCPKKSQLISKTRPYLCPFLPEINLALF